MDKHNGSEGIISLHKGRRRLGWGALGKLNSSRPIDLTERPKLAAMIGTLSRAVEEMEMVTWTRLGAFFWATDLADIRARVALWVGDGEVAAFIMNADRWERRLRVDRPRRIRTKSPRSMLQSQINLAKEANQIKKRVQYALIDLVA